MAAPDRSRVPWPEAPLNPKGVGRVSGREWRRLCCNGCVIQHMAAMAAAIYLALVGGGLTLAVVASFVLRSIKLI